MKYNKVYYALYLYLKLPIFNNPVIFKLNFIKNKIKTLLL